MRIQLVLAVGFVLGGVSLAAAECDGHKAAEAAKVVVNPAPAGSQKPEIVVTGAPGQAVKVEAPQGYSVTATGGAGAPGTPGKSGK